MELMLPGLTSYRAVTGLRSRKAMLETLVQQLNMVRLTVGALALVLMAGCTGLIEESSEGIAPEEQLARDLFTTKAAPALNTFCLSCHNGSRPNIDFLVGTSDLEVRAALIAFDPPVVNLTAPQSSRLLTKGSHEGPALSATSTSDILEWIRAEKDAQPDPGLTDPTANLETAPFLLRACVGPAGSTECPVNDIDLTDIGLPGTRIQFVAQGLGSGIYLNQLKVVGGPMGVYLEHPLFASRPENAEALPDSIDRYFAVKMNLMASAEEQLAGGTAAFVGWNINDRVSILFKTIKAYQPDAGGGGGGGGGGCKVLASFKTNVVPRLQASCASCHAGGDANAVSAMNITGYDSATDATAQTACNQVLTRVNLTTPDNSGLFIAPAVGNVNHPFAFPDAGTFDAFKNPLLTWINAERTAP